MRLSKLSLLAAAVAASSFLAPAADAAPGARPPVVWLKGEGNFTKSHRPVASLDKIVVHVTEGAFWGSVQLAEEPARARLLALRRLAARQDRPARPPVRHRLARGQLERQHAVGRDRARGLHVRAGRLHERAVPRVRAARRLDRPPLAAADRPARTSSATRRCRHPVAGRGGSSHHTDPGPNWKWDYYLRLVRRYAGAQKLSVLPVVPPSPLRGIVPWRAKATGDIGKRRVLDRRPRRRDRPPSRRSRSPAG